MKKSLLLLSIILFSIILIAAVTTSINDFFMPGSQPGDSGNIESPDKCDNCHGGYDQTIEPAFNWRGSMMAQAARDPLFYACLAIANQDAPESGDLCIRCHAPDGWLNGRSTPTDGSALNNNDREGVQCDFCHKLVKPSEIGINPFPDNVDYTANTFQSDQDYLGTIIMIPPQSGNGMYVAHSSNAKRGPFTDAAAKHQIFYSPFHSQSDICGTCHDVSSPVIDKDSQFTLGGINKGVDAFNTYNMLPIERTFSEWKMSAFAQGGVSGTPFGGNKSTVSTCQDCHMHDVSGVAANKRGTVYRDDLPLHDLTGGNTFIPDLVAQLYPGEVNTAALDAGKQRALFMLQNAATLNLSVSNNIATVKVTNNTGHKLPSGYPEGRRIWINLQAYDAAGNIIYESGAYDYATATLEKTGTKIYEIRHGMTSEITTASGVANEEDGSSFHFVLNNKVIKDNRIPPLGFTNAGFESIQSPVIGYSYADNQNYDEITYNLNSTPTYVVARLMYQTTSKEYIEFLRDENRTNNAGTDLYNLWEASGKSAPVVMCEAKTGTTPTPPEIPLAINLQSVIRNSEKGSKVSVSFNLKVTDNNNQAVTGASVSGVFTGPTTGSVSGTTDNQGLLTFTSRSTRNPVGEWCLQIIDITKTGYIYTGSDSWCESDLKSAFIENEIPSDFNLNVYPNPFTDRLSFEFVAPEDNTATIVIYDNLGRNISTVLNSAIKKGVTYKAEFIPENNSRNIYFYQFTIGDRVITGKVVLKK